MEEIADQCGIPSLKTYDGLQRAEKAATEVLKNAPELDWFTIFHGMSDRMGPDWFSPEDAIDDFRQLHSETIKWARTSDDEDRAMFVTIVIQNWMS